MKSGNARARSKKRRVNRNKVWDLIATKAMLTVQNPAEIFATIPQTLMKLNIEPSKTTRERLWAALQRAGIKPMGFIYQVGTMRNTRKEYAPCPSKWMTATDKTFAMDFADIESRVLGKMLSDIEIKNSPTEIVK